MRFPARILGIILALLVGLFFVKYTLAQTSSPQQSISLQQYETPNTDPGVPQNLHTWTQSVVMEVMSTMVCQLIGIDPVNPNQQCLGIDQNTGKIGYVNSGGGAIGMLGTMVGGLYTVPVRFGDYVAYVSNDFGIIKQANAQLEGIGFVGLEPVLVLWRTFRDIAYLVFVLLFLVIGIAVMLRVNIDARTVMTIQNQIPKLIIGILLVTFSYAIAGFLVDLMWIGNYVVVNTIAPSTTYNANDIMAQAKGGVPGFANYIFAPANGSIINSGGIVSVTAGSAGGIGNLIGDLFSPNNTSAKIDTATTDCGWNPLCNIGSFIGGSIQNLIGNIIGLIVSWVARIAAFVIIAIALLWALLKLWFSLIKAFVFVLIDVVLGPFWIVAGLFPKAPPSLGFGSWLKDLVANLAVFPTILGLFMFGRVILDRFGQGNATQFSPPLIGSTLNLGGIADLIALGIILMSPGIADAVKKAIKASSPPTGLGGLSMGTAAVTGFVGGAYGNLMKRDQTGRAVGRGALWADQHIRNRFVSGALGWNQQTPEQIKQQVQERKGNYKAEEPGSKASTSTQGPIEIKTSGGVTVKTSGGGSQTPGNTTG